MRFARKKVNSSVKINPMIDPNILQTYNGQKKTFSKGDLLFREGHAAQYYFQVVSGEIKMYNFNDEGKEFIQGIFTENDSFGEPPLFNKKLYLTNAVATEQSVVWVLTKADFFQMMESEHEVALSVCLRLSDRLYYKSIMAMEISSEDAEHRLLRLFDFLKDDVAHLDKHQKYHITLTRQELADLTGLRVETVIRAVKSLEKKKAVSIVDRKIFR